MRRPPRADRGESNPVKHGRVGAVVVAAAVAEHPLMTSHPNPPGGDREPHLSVCELARRWRVAPKTLYNRRVSGENIPRAFKNGGRLAFRLRDVEEHERARLTSSTSEVVPRTV
jgi:hypothetical protein